MALSISVFSLFFGSKPVLKGNEGAHFYTVRNLVQFNSFDIDPKLLYLGVRSTELGLDMSEHNGKIYSNKPPGFPLIIYPFYYLFCSFFKEPLGITGIISSIVDGFVFCRMVNVILTSFAVGLIYLLSKSFFTDRKSAMLAAVISGLGTNILIYSTLLTSHCASVLFYILSLQFAFSYIKSEYKVRGYLFLFSFFCVYSILIDYSSLFAVFLIAVYLFYRAVKKNHVAFFVIPYILLGACFVYYNYTLFGRVLTTPLHYYRPPPYVEWNGVTDAFKNNFFKGFFGLTLSPSRGVFILSPVLIFSFFGAYKKIKARDVYSILAGVSFLSMLIAMSFYKFWHGGHSIGYRHMLIVVPVLAIFASVSYGYLKKPALKALFIVLLIFSIAANIAGSLIQKEDSVLLLTWKEEPEDIHSSFFTELIPAFLKSKKYSKE